MSILSEIVQIQTEIDRECVCSCESSVHVFQLRIFVNQTQWLIGKYSFR